MLTLFQRETVILTVLAFSFRGKGGGGGGEKGGFMGDNTQHCALRCVSVVCILGHLLVRLSDKTQNKQIFCPLKAYAGDVIALNFIHVSKQFLII